MEHTIDTKKKEDRIKIVNAIIMDISSRGRNFFKHKDRIAFVFYEGNKLYMKNEYNEIDMCLNTKNGYPPKNWTNGGTLWGLTKDFKDFIQSGDKSNHNNGYGGLYCPHWGYSEEDMLDIQDNAKKLGYL